jgi:hypothetical protein
MRCCYTHAQDTPVTALPYVLGPETTRTLDAHFGQRPTLQQIINLQEEVINALECTVQIKQRVRALRVLVVRLSPHAQKLDTIRAICTCPLSLEVVKHGIMVPCCGAVFEKALLFTHMSGAIQKECPLCRRIISMAAVLNSAQTTAIDRIMETLNAT